METKYGNKLNPEHSLRATSDKKGTRQKIIITHNPIEMDQNQLLLVRFLNLGSDDVIVMEMVNLPFSTELSSTTDTNRMLVSNVNRAIMKNLGVKFEGNEILSMDNCNMLACYQDLCE